MTKETILSIFKQTEALLEGHFQLTSGLHSPVYFQCAKVLQYPEYATSLCSEIVQYFRTQKIDVVIAPAIGGVVVSQEVGRQLNVRTIFAERKDKTMELRRGFFIKPNEHVLVCEDVITTGGSVQEVIEIVKREQANVVGVASIVDRSNGKATFPNFHPVLTMEAITYQPEGCPLCTQGIPVEKPGSRKVIL
ncbi:MAG: orotate phosphoribosyltransferase [Ignavibacteriae bacterium]|nr:orotate phosphoribosyltransferase [Ignavibacteriota bacterium]